MAIQQASTCAPPGLDHRLIAFVSYSELAMCAQQCCPGASRVEDTDDTHSRCRPACSEQAACETALRVHVCRTCWRRGATPLWRRSGTTAMRDSWSCRSWSPRCGCFCCKPREVLTLWPLADQHVMSCDSCSCKLTAALHSDSVATGAGRLALEVTEVSSQRISSRYAARGPCCCAGLQVMALWPFRNMILAAPRRVAATTDSASSADASPTDQAIASAAGGGDAAAADSTAAGGAAGPQQGGIRQSSDGGGGAAGSRAGAGTDRASNSTSGDGGASSSNSATDGSTSNGSRPPSANSGPITTGDAPLTGSRSRYAK